MTPPARFAWDGLAVLVCLVCACGQPKPAEEPTTPESDASAEPPAPPSPAPPTPSLYERLGKKDALAGVVEELMGNVLADNRISRLFEKARKDKNRGKQLPTRWAAARWVVA